MREREEREQAVQKETTMKVGTRSNKLKSPSKFCHVEAAFWCAPSGTHGSRGEERRVRSFVCVCVCSVCRVILIIMIIMNNIYDEMMMIISDCSSNKVV